jgi:hypothetical protein
VWSDVLRALATIVLVCAAFTAVGSLVLVGYTRANPALDFIDDPAGLWLRVALFSGITIGSVALLSRLRGAPPTPLAPPMSREISRGATVTLPLFVLIVTMLLGARTGIYPWAAPDEVHHLIVARNLAEYGAYASGHPETGFKYFDSFDSIGPVVIGPVALAFKIFGTSLETARCVMVAFFLGLCLATYGFSRGLFGDKVALVSVALLVGTYSSIYLGRTLYGEVPAYFFLLLGLIAWRRALVQSAGSEKRRDRYQIVETVSASQSGSGVSVPPACGGAGGVEPFHDIAVATPALRFTPPAPPQAGGSLCAQGDATTSQSPGALRASIAWGLLAGALVACAVLAKTIIMLVAFSFFGTWLYDRVTHRCIGWRQVVFPCIGGAVVLAAWSLFQRWHGVGQADSGGVLAIYQHYLLFGVSSVVGAFKHAILPHPMAHLAWLGVMLATVPLLFRHRHDPPAMVLYCYAIFMLYWWFFFTPGHLHRYLWNAYAILAIFGAPWLLWVGRCAVNSRLSRAHRALATIGVVMLAWPGLHWALLQTREIATNDEMSPEYALVEAVEALPSEVHIGTDVHRLPGLLNFFGERVIETGTDPIALLADFDVVITRDTPSLRAALPATWRVQPAGDFVLLSNAQTTE